MRPTLGTLLRAGRKAKGLTLRAVAQALGVSTPYVGDVEQGERTISATRLRQLAEVLGVSGAPLKALYRAAGVLPPEVARRLLAAPEAWDYDPGRLVQGVKRRIRW